jgi:hypothetical protein
MEILKIDSANGPLGDGQSLISKAIYTAMATLAAGPTMVFYLLTLGVLQFLLLVSISD